MSPKASPLISFLRFVALFAFAFSGSQQSSAQTWDIAKPGLVYEFPRDHGAHPSYKTEWWYFTGSFRNTQDADQLFGFELTFFRQGIRPPGSEPQTESRFIVPAFAFAHLALTDLPGNRFLFDQKITRGAFNESGWAVPGAVGTLAWIDDWTLELLPDGAFRLRGASKDFALNLKLTSTKPPVIHGVNGISQKAEGEGRASYYYSMTRLKVGGELKLNGKTIPVAGESWFDHEWATNQLAADQVGWNWLSLQLEDGTEVMLYQMRLKNGGVDAKSSATFVDRDGSSTHFTVDEFKFEPGRKRWKSPATGAEYPMEWRVSIPRLQMEFMVQTPMEKQELALPPIAYWEGLIYAKGTRNGKPIAGHGYVELTGYSGPLVGLGGGK